jgi:site-specific DNA-methyltransferase (cytosine-N4-specific)
LHRLLHGDAVERLRQLDSESVHCVVTSPPYYSMRSYLAENDPTKTREIGLGGSEYVSDLVGVFSEVKRVLRKDGTLWLNLGDVYEDGQLLGLPWMVARRLKQQGWILRQDIVWAKPSPMPESATTRCTRSHEYVFMFAKTQDYFYDAEAIKEESDSSPSGKNRRSVWRIASTPYAGAHFATMPTTLAELCIKAGTSERGCCDQCGTPLRRRIEKQKIVRQRPNDYVKRVGKKGTGNSCSNSVAGVLTNTVGWDALCKCESSSTPCVVLDPFAGSGTTLAVAETLGRGSIGIELNSEYIKIAKKRIAGCRA